MQCKGDECCERRERTVEEVSWRFEEGSCGKFRVQSINKNKELAEVKTKEEDA